MQELLFVLEVSERGGNCLGSGYFETVLDFLGVDEERLEGTVGKTAGREVG